MPAPDASATRLQEPLLVDDLVDRSARRELEFGPVGLNIPADLLSLSLVIGIDVSDLEDRVTDLACSGPGSGVRGASLIRQRFRAAVLEAGEPFVASLAADSVPAAKLGNAELWNEDVTLIDARPFAAYEGTATPSPNLPRNGHIPGAHSVFWQQLIVSPTNRC